MHRYMFGLHVKFGYYKIHFQKHYFTTSKVETALYASENKQYLSFNSPKRK